MVSNAEQYITKIGLINSEGDGREQYVYSVNNSIFFTENPLDSN